MDLRKTGCEGAGSIQLVQDRVQWQAVVNMVMTLTCSTKGQPSDCRLLKKVFEP